MRKLLVCFLFLWTNLFLSGQELTLPSDFRQHGLTQFNANLLNATYAVDWNTTNSLALWTRWQWQTIDGDPTTLFANYTHQLNPNSVVTVGFLQHNTGTFLDTGANLGYVHVFQLDGGVRLMASLNLFAFQEKLADDRFVPDPQIMLPELDDTNSFVLQFSPAFRLQVNQFNLGLAFENAVGINLSDSDGSNNGNFKIVTGTISNDIPISIFPNNNNDFIRPIIYVKSIPDGDTQFGVNGLLSTSWFWVQGGYNNFYGPSGGVGVTIAKQFSIGGLMEFGTDNVLRDTDSTIELIAAYHFGKPDTEEKIDESEEEGNALEEERLRLEEEKRQEKERLAEEKRLEKERLAEEKRLRKEQVAEEKRKKKELQAKEKQKQQELIEAEKRLEQERLDEEKAAQEEAARQLLQQREQAKKDSVERVQQEIRKLEEQKRKDSIAALQKAKVEVKPNERYQEVKSEAGLTPGFYLIANVFGTKKYYDKFMQTLGERGLEPKSFYRNANKYNYVYLERYDSIDEARKARDSKFFGKYQGDTWIFRVRGE